MNSDNKATLLKANAAVAAGDNEGFLSFCAENIRYEFVGDQTLHGKDAVRAYMKEAYLEPPEFDVEHLIAEGDLVSAMGKISMTDESGKKINYSYCDVWRFQDGKMAELRAYVIEIP